MLQLLMQRSAQTNLVDPLILLLFLISGAAPAGWARRPAACWVAGSGHEPGGPCAGAGLASAPFFGLVGPDSSFSCWRRRLIAAGAAMPTDLLVSRQWTDHWPAGGHLLLARSCLFALPWE